MLDFGHYLWITGYCIVAGRCCTTQIREELSQLSFQTLHSVSEFFRETGAFWGLLVDIVDMLEKQVSRDY